LINEGEELLFADEPGLYSIFIEAAIPDILPIN